MITLKSIYKKHGIKHEPKILEENFISSGSDPSTNLGNPQFNFAKNFFIPTYDKRVRLDNLIDNG